MFAPWNGEPESALRKANEKFSARFEQLEHAFEARGESVHDATLEQMEDEWQRVKGPLLDSLFGELWPDRATPGRPQLVGAEKHHPRRQAFRERGGGRLRADVVRQAN